jgi:O-antigen/teichoic acid export membrane protein
MSRIKRFAHSLVSGYALLAVNVLYTLASVPLALHYLSIKEFGLWAVVSQVAMNLQLLIDFGMSGSVGRILIDHKDNPDSTGYGTVIQTGFLALLVQGMLLAVSGSLIALWLPQWMKVPVEFWQVFRWLMIGQCVLLGASFTARIFTFILQAHQRYDLCNYAQIGGFVLNLLGLWLGFKWKLGLYSLLVGTAAGMVFSNGLTLIAVWQLWLLPAKGRWGHASWISFKEIFSYANAIFLLSVGQILISLCQTPLISRMLGLEAAAIWSIATKMFTFAQQMIARIHDFSAAAFAEMMVRGERVRLQSRFRDQMILTAAAGAFVCLAVALCNESFLKIWTHSRISWGIQNDLLMALYIITITSTRCHIGLAGLTKQIRAMKYIYILEGAAFVALSLLLAPRMGLAGVIVSGIISDLLCSGLYGLKRTTGYFNIPASGVLGWLKLPVRLFLVMLCIVFVLWLTTRNLAAPTQLMVDVLASGITGGYCFWRIGLPSHLQNEVAVLLQKGRARLWKKRV